LKQVGGLPPRVLTKVTYGLQAGQDDEISIVDGLPQFPRMRVQIDVRGQTGSSLFKVALHS
jgi:hypothetical protein